MKVFLCEEFYIFLVKDTIAILVVPDSPPGSKGNSVLSWTALVIFVVCIFVRFPTEDKRNEFFESAIFISLLYNHFLE